MQKNYYGKNFEKDRSAGFAFFDIWKQAKALLDEQQQKELVNLALTPDAASRADGVR